MKRFQKKFSSALRIARARGLDGIRMKLREYRRRREEGRLYLDWMKANEITANDRQRVFEDVSSWPRQPLISIVMPVYNVDEKWLRLCLDSVLNQIYDKWELCIADDASPAPQVRRVLTEYAARDSRVRVLFRTENGHISKASNSALELATGEFCILLDHDDELAPDAVYRVAEIAVSDPEAAFIYSDEDMIDESGRRHLPKFKPDFSRDLLYSLNLITHLSAYKTSVLREIGGFRTGVEGSQDYDLALRVLEKVGDAGVRHIPRILYHWRAIAGSVALSSDEKPYAHERARMALREHFERTGTNAEVQRGRYQFHRVRYLLPAPLPKVGVVLWPHQGVCQAKIESDYPSVQFLRVESYDAAAFNRAVASFGDEISVICFLRGDLLPETTDWLRELTSFAVQDGIGVVGGFVGNERTGVVQAGTILGFDGLAATAHRGYDVEADGYFMRLCVIGNYSAVSGESFCVKRRLFDELGGFDEKSFGDSLFDLDFCLRARELGKRVVFTPYARFCGGAARVTARPETRARFLDKWPAAIANDPFYNPHLRLDRETFEVMPKRTSAGRNGGEG